MFFAQEEAHLENQAYETVFTANEIQELLSLFEFESPTVIPNSGSEGSNQAVDSTDEKKRKRMLSNRESARRSRSRKKRHLEDLTEQLKRLKIENQELKNQLGLVLNQCHILWRENDRLLSESAALQARLSGLYHVFVAMQNHPNNHHNFNWNN